MSLKENESSCRAQDFFDNRVDPAPKVQKTSKPSAMVKYAWLFSLLVPAISVIVLLATIRQISIFVGSNYLYEGGLFFLWAAVFFRSALKAGMAIRSAGSIDKGAVRKRLLITGFTVGLLMAYIPTSTYFSLFLTQESFDIFYIATYILVVVIPPAHGLGSSLGELLFYVGNSKAGGNKVTDKVFSSMGHGVENSLSLIWYRGFDGALLGVVSYAVLVQFFRADTLALYVSMAAILSVVGTFDKASGLVKHTLGYTSLIMFVSVIYSFNTAGAHVIDFSTPNNNYSIYSSGEEQVLVKNSRVVVRGKDKTEYVSIAKGLVSGVVGERGTIVSSGLSLLKIANHVSPGISVFNHVEDPKGYEAYIKAGGTEIEVDRLSYGAPSLLGVKIKARVDLIVMDAVEDRGTYDATIVNPIFLAAIGGKINFGGRIAFIIPSTDLPNSSGLAELAGGLYRSCFLSSVSEGSSLALIECVKG